MLIYLLPKAFKYTSLFAQHLKISSNERKNNSNCVRDRMTNLKSFKIHFFSFNIRSSPHLFPSQIGQFGCAAGELASDGRGGLVIRSLDYKLTVLNNSGYLYSIDSWVS